MLDVASTCLLGGMLVGCLYWSAVTYGAVTVMQVYGHERGLDAMESINPVVLLTGLPPFPSVCSSAAH